MMRRGDDNDNDIRRPRGFSWREFERGPRTAFIRHLRPLAPREFPREEFARQAGRK